MNKKFIIVKIIFINIVGIIALLAGAEFYCQSMVAINYPECKINPYKELRQFEDSFPTFEKDWMRKPVGEEYKNEDALVIFGGSFGYGTSLTNENTLSYKLSKYLKKTVYNRAYPSGSPTQMLFQLQKTDIFEKIPKVDTVLYVYTEDEMARLYKILDCEPSNVFNPRYEIKNGKLERIKTDKNYDKIMKLYVAKELRERVIEPKLAENQEKTFDLFFEIFKESKAIADKKWNNPNFILLKYPIYRTDRQNLPDCSEKYTKYKGWERFDEIGITVVDTQSLVGNEVCSAKYVVNPDNDYHPNEAAWELIIPKLIAKTEIK